MNCDEKRTKLLKLKRGQDWPLKNINAINLRWTRAFSQYLSKTDCGPWVCSDRLLIVRLTDRYIDRKIGGQIGGLVDI